MLSLQPAGPAVPRTGQGDSGDHLLIDRGPLCGFRFAWDGGGPLDLCNSCGNFMTAPHADHVPGAVLRRTAPLLALIDPDHARRAEDLSDLHPDLAELDRGAVFELGWRIATQSPPEKRMRDEPDLVAVRRSATMPRRDAEWVLNINPRYLNEAMRAELASALHGDGGLVVERVLDMAKLGSAAPKSRPASWPDPASCPRPCGSADCQGWA